MRTRKRPWDLLRLLCAPPLFNYTFNIHSAEPFPLPFSQSRSARRFSSSTRRIISSLYYPPIAPSLSSFRAKSFLCVRSYFLSTIDENVTGSPGKVFPFPSEDNSTRREIVIEFLYSPSALSADDDDDEISVVSLSFSSSLVVFSSPSIRDDSRLQPVSPAPLLFVLRPNIVLSWVSLHTNVQQRDIDHISRAWIFQRCVPYNGGYRRLTLSRVLSHV